MINILPRNLLFISSVFMLGALGQGQKVPVTGCVDPYGPPNSEACVDYQMKRCICRSWSCLWTCPPGGCQRCPEESDKISGGCSDPSDLDVDLRAELDSQASSCEFPCNCIASGNQIAHKLNVETPQECDHFCKSFPAYCHYWTLIKSKGVCFALTNCNYPKCGPPFHTYVSGPKGCPPGHIKHVPESSFTITNRVRSRIAAGDATFQGTALKGCDRSYKMLQFGGITTITIPTSCLPLIKLTATLNGNTICTPFIGLENLPNNVFICPDPNGSANCFVSMNQNCKK